MNYKPLNYRNYLRNEQMKAYKSGFWSRKARAAKINCIFKCFIIKASRKKLKKMKKYFVGEKKVCIFAPRFSGNIKRYVQKSSESRSLGGKPVDL
jgi:hypothetical protein